MSKNDFLFEVTGGLNDDRSALLIDQHRMLNRLRRYQQLDGKELEITFRIKRKKRSDRQNRYMWGVIVPVVQSWMKDTNGHLPGWVLPDRNAVYVWLNTKVLGNEIKVKDVMGDEVLVMEGKRFSQMNTKEFEEAVAHIREEMRERGCRIPEPNEENYLTDHLHLLDKKYEDR